MDIVVCVPVKAWSAWLREGDRVGERPTGQEYGFRVQRIGPTKLYPGDRVYIVCKNKVRGYAKLLRIEHHGGFTLLIRGSDARAVTIDAKVPSFESYRYRWWTYQEEKPFPLWDQLD